MHPVSINEIRNITDENSDYPTVLVFDEGKSEITKTVIERISIVLKEIERANREVVVVDCDIVKDAKSEYKIAAIPTVLIICGNRELNRVTELKDDQFYKELIEEGIQKANNSFVIEIQSKDQFKELLDLKKLIVLDFYGNWCFMCSVLKPHLDILSKEFVDTIVFAKVDIDCATGRFLAKEFDITVLPTLCCVEGKSGEEGKNIVNVDGNADNGGYVNVAMKEGFKSHDDLREFVKSAMENLKNMKSPSD